jgi:glyoxylase-like metal-dependent hydrolase (beta-lactamase superfamily II)
MAPRIDPIRLQWSNAYLVRHSNAALLVDCGGPADRTRLVAALARHGVAPADLAAVICTHGHADHAGGAAALRAAGAGPIVVHGADWHMTTAGHNAPLQPQGVTARLLRPLVDFPFPAFTPDIDPGDRLDLGRFGVDGEVLHAGGHTDGSVVVRLATGDVLAGDLLRGGHLGGQVLPHRPLDHYYCDHPQTRADRVRWLLSLAPTAIHPGHGGVLSAASVARRWPPAHHTVPA